MPADLTRLTPYADVNAILADLRDSVQAVLGAHFVGLYLYGSLALGDFVYDRSDLDFLVVTDDDLPVPLVDGLAAMHARIAAENPTKWANELEGVYVPRRALRRYDPADATFPRIDRGEHFRIEHHDSDWIIQLHVLRAYGIVLAGPPLAALIDPVSPADLRRAVLETLHGWFAPMLDDPGPLQHAGYRGYAVLTMCRMCYTLRHGTITTKTVAVAWAAEALDPRWTPLIWQALAWELRTNPVPLDETLAFIRATVAWAGEWQL